MPFFTEELWGYIPHEGKALIVAKWPEADKAYLDDQAEASMSLLMDLVRGIRNARTEYNVDPARRITAVFGAGSQKSNIERYSYLFSRLCNVSHVITLADGAGAPDDAASVVVSDVTAYLPLAGMIDVQAERERLGKEQAKLQEQIAKSQNMLGNEQFVSRAKPEVVEKERARLADLQASAAQIAERLAALSN
jgi:valyl-tRNA synthetase